MSAETVTLRVWDYKNQHVSSDKYYKLHIDASMKLHQQCMWYHKRCARDILQLKHREMILDYYFNIILLMK